MQTAPYNLICIIFTPEPMQTAPYNLICTIFTPEPMKLHHII
jgi:hypothetical protein